MKSLASALVASVCIWAASAEAQTQTAYDTLGGTNTFDTVFGNIVQGANPAANPNASYELVIQATPFVPTVSGFITSVTLPLGIAAGTNSFNIYLAPSNAAQTGPAEFDTDFFQYTLLGNVAAGGAFPGTYGAVTLTTVSNPLIGAGTTYWLVVEPGAADTSGAWNLTAPNSGASQSFAPIFGSSFDTNGAGSSGAMRIVVVPEPGTVIAGALLAGMALCRLVPRQRRRSAL